MSDYHKDTAFKATSTANAIIAGKFRFREEDREWVSELLGAPRGPTGLVDTRNLSPKTLSMARSTALAVAYLDGQTDPASNKLEASIQDTQYTLFELFAQLFSGLVGRGYQYIEDSDIKGRMLERTTQEWDAFERETNTAVERLADFYNKNAAALFSAAKQLGGVKAVHGGQRAFVGASTKAVRISGMYLDTQLIPDPIYPFLSSDLHLNARYLQLALTLYQLLQLRPLVDAELPEPPIFVFPSFDQALEQRDAQTQAGIADLCLSVVGPVLDTRVTTIGELYDYASHQGDAFLRAVLREHLFVPLGADPAQTFDADAAHQLHLAEIKGIVSDEVWKAKAALPPSILALITIQERLSPQYHLRENAEELNAQAILSQKVHWHFFEKCAFASAKSLENKKVLTPEALVALKALQDDSLGWLSAIPVEGLVDMRKNLEHVEFRKELKDCIAQLSSAGSVELSDAVREVNHKLQVLVQKQQKAIQDVQNKYSPKRWAAGLGVGTSAAMLFLPSLGFPIGTASALGLAAAASVFGYAKEMISQKVETEQTKKTMLGLLAFAYSKR